MAILRTIIGWASSLKVAIFLLFAIAISSAIGTAIPQGEPVQNYLELGKDKSGRMKIKEKIFHELEQANKKEQILNEREGKIISKFLRKIQKEINSYNDE